MPAATMTSKGQITIPAKVRAELGLTTGDKVVFEPFGDGYRVVPSHRNVTRLAGFFGPYMGEPVSVEQMNRDIEAEVAK